MHPFPERVAGLRQQLELPVFIGCPLVHGERRVHIHRIEPEPSPEKGRHDFDIVPYKQFILHGKPNPPHLLRFSLDFQKHINTRNVPAFSEVFKW